MLDLKRLSSVAAVAAADRLRQAGNPTRRLPERQQVDMVRHQYERVELAVVLHQRFAKVGPVGAVVVSVEKQRLTIIAALHDVLRNIRQVEARKASHRA